MNIIIYFLVGIIATTIGAISGIGGGVIIKPVLDILGDYNIATIGVLSSFTVFAMSVVSLGKTIKDKMKLDGKRTVSLAVGSILGGYIGKNLFSIFLNLLKNDVLAKQIQAGILFLLMVIVLFLYIKEGKIKGIKVHNVVICTIVGIVLGIISSFLGIGGGPLNVVILIYLLGMDTKSSAIHSIFIIFFSQGSKLLSILIGEGFGVYNLEVLPFMVIGGIFGGLLGSFLSKKMNKDKVRSLFISCMILIILSNLYNIVSA